MGEKSQPVLRPVLLAEIERVWVKAPTLRFCQFLVNVAGKDPFYVEDADLMAKLKEFEERYIHG